MAVGLLAVGTEDKAVAHQAPEALALQVSLAAVADDFARSAAVFRDAEPLLGQGVFFLLKARRAGVAFCVQRLLSGIKHFLAFNTVSAESERTPT